jgi:hypothetical protein
MNGRSGQWASPSVWVPRLARPVGLCLTIQGSLCGCTEGPASGRPSLCGRNEDPARGRFFVRGCHALSGQWVTVSLSLDLFVSTQNARPVGIPLRVSVTTNPAFCPC